MSLSCSQLVWRICALFWYNCANNDDGAKFGANETDITNINNRIGGILELSYFWQNFIMYLFHTKAFDHKSKKLKTYFSNLFISETAEKSSES